MRSVKQKFKNLKYTSLYKEQGGGSRMYVFNIDFHNCLNVKAFISKYMEFCSKQRFSKLHSSFSILYLSLCIISALNVGC